MDFRRNCLQGICRSIEWSFETTNVHFNVFAHNFVHRTFLQTKTIVFISVIDSLSSIILLPTKVVEHFLLERLEGGKIVTLTHRWRHTILQKCDSRKTTGETLVVSSCMRRSSQDFVNWWVDQWFPTFYSSRTPKQKIENSRTPLWLEKEFYNVFIENIGENLILRKIWRTLRDSHVPQVGNHWCRLISQI